MLRKILAVGAASLALAGFGTGVAQAQTNFQKDVSTAIDKGLAWFQAQGAYNNPATFGSYASGDGLATLALLQKRPSANPNAPPLGYANAAPADQPLIRTSVAFLLTLSANAQSNPDQSDFDETYRDGAILTALTNYVLTGGPEACTSVGGDPTKGDRPCQSNPGTPTELQNAPVSVYKAIQLVTDELLRYQHVATLISPYTNLPYQDYLTGATVTGTDLGYWCYNEFYYGSNYYSGCDDSSTTQYAALGLASALAVFGPGNANVGQQDVARTAAINTALNLAARAYVVNAAQGSDDGATCTGPGLPYGALTSTERGHGYHANANGFAYYPSLEQTSSGLFVQVLGGANVNTPTVQSYMQWVRNHYRYTDINNLGNSWPYYSYWYYLWSSFKGQEFLIQQNNPVQPGNLDPGSATTSHTSTSYGTLAPGAAPACADRQASRNPAADSQVALFGAGGPGYYAAENQSQYYDYAYTILSYQCPDGSFTCNGAPQSWAGADAQAYALLVLLRATGVAVPTATLVSSAPSASVGTHVTLTWSSTNASSCTASGGAPGDGWAGALGATSGSKVVTETAAATYTYTVNCSAGAQTATANVNVDFTGGKACDMNSDGIVNTADLTILQGYVLGKKLAPVNPPLPGVAPGQVVTTQVYRACALQCTNAGCK